MSPGRATSTSSAARAAPRPPWTSTPTSCASTRAAVLVEIGLAEPHILTARDDTDLAGLRLIAMLSVTLRPAQATAKATEGTRDELARVGARRPGLDRGRPGRLRPRAGRAAGHVHPAGLRGGDAGAREAPGRLAARGPAQRGPQPPAVPAPGAPADHASGAAGRHRHACCPGPRAA